MMIMNIYLLTVGLGLFYSVYIFYHDCPRVKTYSDVDIDKFVKHTWYSQYQQEVAYQTKDSLYCVTATYNIEPERKVPLFFGNVISVYNYANYDKINGPPMNTKNGTILCAKQPNPKDYSKLRIAPCNVPGFLGGPYWIIGIGQEYEWAVISGGQPTKRYNDGCTTNLNATNNAGLWIFSRTPVISDKYLGEAKKLLLDKGYTLSQLIKVEQYGCSYIQAFIK